MQANAVTLLFLFERKLRLEIPLFQRPYVWTREHQWEPLWEDISRKFTEFIEGRKDTPVHFLGAMVLDQKQTPSTHVEKRQVIDGQQRLTTLQLFLAALRDFCRENECEELAKELESYTLNKGMMTHPEVEKYKVWPTQADRSQFADVMGLGSRVSVESAYPLTRQKFARKDDLRPPMVEAYLFFHDQIREFFVGSDGELPVGSESPLAMRIDESFQALKNALKVVAIDLERDDDAQVIFETLNARGEPLLPADLLRNYIFLRAARLNESAESLYNTHWRAFDETFWRETVSQGRISRPRSDLFMQHFLASRKGTDVPIKHLFAEYKSWIEREKPFSTITEEISTLARQRDDFRRIIAPESSDPLYRFARFLDRFDLRTVYPLILFLLEVKMPAAELADVCKLLESYIVRRAIVGWHTKNYTRTFLNLTKLLRETTPTSNKLEVALSALKGDSFAWPKDTEFKGAWTNGNAYDELQQAKLVHILERINEAIRDCRTEEVTIDSRLTIEHILPQSWISNWPLASGENGMTSEELDKATPIDLRAMATRKRNSSLQTFGNLTILTQGLNSTVSNSSWQIKRAELQKLTVLPINIELNSLEKWDEFEIESRANRLFNLATQLWPPPKEM